MYPLLAIAGPTASGKSDLALYLAEHFDGEIVNYDSVQVYRHFDIGTAKPAWEHRRRVPHHMIDMREPGQVFSAGDYQREARRVLENIRLREKLPILVGGTGLYLRALTEGLFNGPSRSLYWRNRLETTAERKGCKHLHRTLARFDPAAADRIARTDRPKIIRALEVRLETGKTLSAYLEERPRQPLIGFNVCLIGLNPARPELHYRINQRVIRMIEGGLADEVKQLLARGVPRSAKPFEAIGYRHVLAGLDSSEPRERTVQIVQRDTRRYAKRQLTWFRRQSEVMWFDGPGDNDEIKKKVRQFVEPIVSQLSYSRQSQLLGSTNGK